MQRIIIAIILSFQVFSQNSLADTESEKLARLAEQFSEMPPRPDSDEPGYRGKKFQFYHILRDLQRNAQYMNPDHGENYIFRAFPHMAPEQVPLMRSTLYVHEQVLQEFKLWRNHPELETFEFNRNPYIPSEGQKLFPARLRYLHALSRLLSTESFLMHYQLADYLRVLDVPKKVYNPMAFFGLASNADTFLKTLSDLSQNGSRTSELLATMAHQRVQSVTEINRSFPILIDGFIEFDKLSPTAQQDLYQLHLDVATKMKETTFALEVSNDLLARVVKYGNDLEKMKLSDLQTEMLKLARGLIYNLEETDRVESDRGKEVFKTKPLQPTEPIVQLSHPHERIPRYLRDSEKERLYRISLVAPDHLAFSADGQKKVMAIYRSALVEQVLMAAGTVVNRAIEQQKYQGIKGKLRWISDKIPVKRVPGPNSTTVVPGNALVAAAHNSLLPQKMTKPNTNDAEIESRLWKSFFAELTRTAGPTTSFAGTVLRQLDPKPAIGQNTAIRKCGSVFTN